MTVIHNILAGPALRARRHRLFLVLALAASMVLAGQTTSSAGPGRAASQDLGDKSYSATIAPDSVAAGAVQEFQVTLTNRSSQQDLGSANLSAPADFRLTGTPSILSGSTGTATLRGDVLELRNLGIPPGGSAIITFAAAIPCDAGDSTWSIAAKQANGFNGPPGNDFTLDEETSSLAVNVVGGCALRFLAQPSDAELDATITTAPVDPTGPPVEVEVIDGAGNRVTSSVAPITVSVVNDPNPPPGATLSGDTTVNAIAGVATFDDLTIDLHGSGYMLRASSPGLLPTTSEPFTIWDEIVRCESNEACSASLRSDDRSMGAVVDTISPTAGTLLMSLGADTLDCGDSFNHAPSTVRVDSIDLGGAKNVTLTVSKAYDQRQSNNGASFYEVCFSGEEPFTDRDGNTVPAGDSGLLPLCSTAGAPCLATRTKIQGGQVQVTILLPPGDPMMR